MSIAPEERKKAKAAEKEKAPSKPGILAGLFGSSSAKPAAPASAVLRAKKKMHLAAPRRQKVDSELPCLCRVSCGSVVNRKFIVFCVEIGSRCVVAAANVVAISFGTLAQNADELHAGDGQKS